MDVKIAIKIFWPFKEWTLNEAEKNIGINRHEKNYKSLSDSLVYSVDLTCIGVCCFLFCLITYMAFLRHIIE